MAQKKPDQPVKDVSLEEDDAFEDFASHGEGACSQTA